MNVAMSVTVPVDVAVLVDSMLDKPEIKNKSQLIVKAIQFYAKKKYNLPY
jgi:metal-responsive CopG/Arc/MetJ family transcriptional regulator